MTFPEAVENLVTVNDLSGPDFTTYEVVKPEEVTQFKGDSFVIIKGKTRTLGRGLKCLAYGGKYWSITLRCDARNTRKSSTEYLKLLKKYLRGCAREDGSVNPKAQNYLGYCPSGHKTYANLFSKPVGGGRTHPKGEIFLNDIYSVCFQLYGILFPNKTIAPSGLIVLTGATDSSKSLITRGLIFLFLEVAARQAIEHKCRRPHLVTFEDPIEQYYIKDPVLHTAPQQLTALEALLTALYIDYTPREKGIDARKLSRVLKDAKRQTPAILFVGETRDHSEWKELLDFAGSGHLVITTSHAGSVVEAMTQIFRSTDTDSASQRSEIARRIRAIINLRSFTPTSASITSNVRALLPALWKSTPQSINNLVADGLSSILPALGRERDLGYYGRSYFAEELLKCSAGSFQGCRDLPHLEVEIRRQARQWDMEGV